MASSVIEARVVLVPEAPITLARNVFVFEVDAPIEVLPGDLISTNAKKGGAQLKDDSGTLAQLGPDTHVAIGNGQSPGERDALHALSLLTGWLKVARTGAGTGATRDPVLIDTPAMRLSLQHGSTVVRATPKATSVYVETGAVETSLPDAPTKLQKLTSDQFADRETGQSLKQAERPSSEFVGQLPLIFRDPLRPLPHGPIQELAPGQGRQASYADIGEWLTSSLPLRGSFVPRFSTLLRFKPFRTELEQHVSDLPEWRQALYPKKPRKSSAWRRARYAHAAKEES